MGHHDEERERGKVIRLTRKSVGIPGVDRPDIALSAYRGRKIERDSRYRQNRDTDREIYREFGRTHNK